MNLRLLPLAAFVLASVVTRAAENPLTLAAQKIGTTGLANVKGIASVAGWPFKPTGQKPYVKAYIDDLKLDKAEAEAFGGAVNEMITNYEGVAKTLGKENDPALALAFSVAVVGSVAKLSELDDKSFLTFADKFRAVLSKTPATDAQKQEFYEESLCSGALVLAVAATAKDDATIKTIKTLAEAQLFALVGAKLSAIHLDGDKATIDAAPATEAPKAPASALTYTMPQGWTQRSGWMIGEINDGSHSSMAQVRLPAAMAAKGSFSDALREAWKANVPTELKERASGMIYRRYVGDGLFAQFVMGAAPLNGKDWNTTYTVMLVDCGSTWQPIVIAQTWDDLTTKFPPGASMSANFSFGPTADMAEVFLRSLRCAGMKIKPIVDAASMVGDYSYGSSSSLQWENIYTGATSMTFVSYSGTLNLKSDGSFTETFGSASGQVGAAKFGSIKAAGTWRIENDILHLKYSMYDQGDSYKREKDAFRIAGVVIFPDGQKVVVLKKNLDTPINGVTVNDRSEYYSTKKK